MPANHAEVHIKGKAELEAAFADLRREVLLGMKPELIALGERVKQEAISRAPDEISNIMGRWGQFRIGISVRNPMVYVAPKVRRRSGSPRPNLAGMLDKVMQESAEHHQEELVAGFEALVDASEAKAGL